MELKGVTLEADGVTMFTLLLCNDDAHYKILISIYVSYMQDMLVSTIVNCCVFLFE